MISRILVPLDGSRRAEGVLPHAAAIASAFSADLTLHRVALASKNETSGFVAPFESDLIRHQSQRYLSEHADHLRSLGHQVSTVVSDGKPIDALLQSVEDLAIDLVVVAGNGHESGQDRGHGNGHGAVGPDYLATAALQLVLAGVCSVMVVHRASDECEDDVVRRVAALLDGSHRSEWAAYLAASIARSHGAALSLLHVVPKPEMPRRAPLTANEIELQASVTAANRSAAEAHLSELRTRLSGPGAAVRVRITEAPQVAPAISRLAEIEGADLLVMSAHGWGCDSGLQDERWPYGAVCESLLLHGSVSLLVFQDLPPLPGWMSVETHGTASTSLAPRRQVTTAVKTS